MQVAASATKYHSFREVLPVMFVIYKLQKRGDLGSGWAVASQKKILFYSLSANCEVYFNRPHLYYLTTTDLSSTLILSYDYRPVVHTYIILRLQTCRPHLYYLTTTDLLSTLILSYDYRPVVHTYIILRLQTCRPHLYYLTTTDL